MRTWNSNTFIVFSHVVLTKTLGVRRAKEILAQITRQMDLWERGLHSGLVWYANAEGSTRKAGPPVAGWRRKMPWQEATMTECCQVS